MWQACRPAGRLFCLVLAVALIVSGVQARGRGAGSARRAERAITDNPQIASMLSNRAPEMA